jgi:hypothetical protein
MMTDVGSILPATNSLNETRTMPLFMTKKSDINAFAMCIDTRYNLIHDKELST